MRQSEQFFEQGRKNRERALVAGDSFGKKVVNMRCWETELKKERLVGRICFRFIHNKKREMPV